MAATDQIRQMVNFILQEAHEKANEIRVKVCVTDHFVFGGKNLWIVPLLLSAITGRSTFRYMQEQETLMLSFLWMDAMEIEGCIRRHSPFIG